ncbi:LEA type 2 family protein [Haloarcula salinisoli]|uniref:LEA type 2 family protein n=1 Tax=Haloarcula salinisoli TaxID=2487746 RepID=A0A8J7YDJ9_9EURY|nr:LEA type 2 family protein [Halomicroarcula salinisoli]MBX0303472.1 LEA type 2 family protein [Halomicroarcula salinisoli]
MSKLAGAVRGLGRVRQVGIAAAVFLAVVVGGFGLGVIGTPGVETVDNRFTSVSENTTTVETAITVSNPNPIGVSLGGTSIDYTVSMNDVAMASGEKQGISLGRGNTTLQFNTTMRNSRIPPWWVSHISNGERTQVTIDANVTDALVGDRSVSLTQNRTIETDILGQFNSTETRPVNASKPFVSDPVLYINETRGSWDRDAVTQSATPMDIEFDVYNPKPVPYAVTKIGYRTYMNDVQVGSGETDSGTIITPGERETIGVRNVIRNQRLDQWWVSHLQRNQNTTLYIDFYLVVEGGGEQFRIDLDAIDYEKPIETDIFGNKDQYPTGGGSESSGNQTADGESGTDGSGTDGDASDGTATQTDGERATPTDDGGLVGDTL